MPAPPLLNLGVAWAAILAGMLSGAAIGLFFKRDDWLGGYGSWRRRLLRLGHIACFGLAFLNLAFVTTVREVGPFEHAALVGRLLAFSALAMPVTCALAAWRRALSALFPISVGAMVASAVITLVFGVLAS